MECGKTFLYIKKRINQSYLFAAVPSRCKSWSCDKCRPIKARIVKNYIKDNFEGEDNYMLSLTFFHSDSVESCWEKIGERWNRMRTYISKKYGAFDYLRVVEPHKKGGWPHMHILIKGCNIHEDVVKMITKWGFGWNMHCVRMGGGSASLYVAKYLSKQWPDISADLHRTASKTRIVCVSRGMPPIFTVASEWAIVKYDAPPVATLYLCNAIIDMLINIGKSNFVVHPFADGFIIESDTEISIPEIETYNDGFCWKRCDAFDFSYLPYGLQERLPL